MADRFGAGRGILLAATLSVAVGLCASRALQADTSLRGKQEQLKSLRASGDLSAQRRHAWDLLSRLVEPSNGEPAFESWYGEGAVFSTDGKPAAQGLRGFSRSGTKRPKNLSGADSAEAAVLSFTLYNAPAYDHIRRHRLFQTAALDQLRAEGEIDRTIVGSRAIPAFPREAMILKSVWWPIAHEGVTALPVWDPELNPARPQGNAYTTWQRVVAVDSRSAPRLPPMATLEFAGRSVAASSRVNLDAFYRVVVDASLAARLNADHDARKAALIALGRVLQQGDSLALISAHLMSNEIDDWVWATFWWHDRPDEGPYAAERPPTLHGVWRSFLAQAAFDAVKPLSADGSPHISFNPWLEARFPDGAHGGGSVSNCVACHSRASYPAVEFLPVTRGAANLRDDPAYAEGRLRTSFLWSIPLHAKP